MELTRGAAVGNQKSLSNTALSMLLSVYRRPAASATERRRARSHL